MDGARPARPYSRAGRGAAGALALRRADGRPREGELAGRRAAGRGERGVRDLPIRDDGRAHPASRPGRRQPLVRRVRRPAGGGPVPRVLLPRSERPPRRARRGPAPAPPVPLRALTLGRCAPSLLTPRTGARPLARGLFLSGRSAGKGAVRYWWKLELTRIPLVCGSGPSGPGGQGSRS